MRASPGEAERTYLQSGANGRVRGKRIAATKEADAYFVRNDTTLPQPQTRSKHNDWPHSRPLHS